jgi:signal transduction histidine kinase
LQVVTLATGTTPSPSPLRGVLFALLGLASGLVLVGRRRYPYPTFGLCAIAYPLQALLLAPPVPAAVAVAAYGLVRRSPGSEKAGSAVSRWTVTALLGAVAAGAAGLALSQQVYWLAPYALVVVTAVTAGLVVANRESHEESRRRELLDRQRLQIARELHDVVGHSAGAIGVQAGAGRLALDAGAVSDARAALVDIETASHTLLREVRWMVGLLRERATHPGLADVEQLIENARRSGLDIRFRSTDLACAVPASTGQAAYRILQEALTNVLRHGAVQRAEVELTVDDQLRLRVRNPTTSGAPRAPRAGNGIQGMRERVQSVGGTLRVGADGESGWIVEAVLPRQVTR